MSIKLNVMMKQEVVVKTVTIHAKVRDNGIYRLFDDRGQMIAELDDYVPNEVIPGSYGGNISLTIDIETGQIANWKKPTAEDIRTAFKLKGDDE